MKRQLLAVLGVGILLFVSVLAFRTVTFRPRPAPSGQAPSPELPPGAAERLAGAVRYATVSQEDGTTDQVALVGLHEYIAASFPRVHTTLTREGVGGGSLLYRWQGADSSARPVLLAAHLDVVPVEPGTDTAWQHPPFEGRIVDGFVWGRGVIDNKSAVFGMLEAVEELLARGHRPNRTVYLAFGHDEEVGGASGARAIADRLRRRGVRLEMVLDEGGVIGEGLLAGIDRPTALVGIAEKGFASVELMVRGDGGHSSLPPKRTTIGILSAAVNRLEQTPLPARLTRATREMFDRVGPHYPPAQRATFANLWLARPLVVAKLDDAPTTNAMVRTTTAVTLFQAGAKDNVLASTARAVVNFRVLQGDSVAGVLAHVRRAVDDSRVEVRRVGRFHAEPSAVSSTDSWGFRRIEAAIVEVVPQAIVTPYTVVVVTDSRHYADLAESVYRFLPVRTRPADLARIHGTNERIAVEDYALMIRIYRQLIAGTSLSDSP